MMFALTLIPSWTQLCIEASIRAGSIFFLICLSTRSEPLSGA